MAKLDLREGEELIEQAAASHVKKVLIMPQAIRQSVCDQSAGCIPADTGPSQLAVRI